MKQLWCPWRIEYITAEKQEGCLFCAKPREDEDATNLILFRGPHAYVMMNRYPYNNGHLLVVPYRHTDSPTALTDEEQLALMAVTNICLEVLEEALHPDGYNVGMNLGAAAGAGIAEHIHLHVVPRWGGDTNFMPVLASTRVIVEALEQSYARLRPLFDRRCAPAPEEPGRDPASGGR